MLRQYSQRRELSKETIDIMNSIKCEKFEKQDYLKAADGPQCGITLGYLCHQQYADVICALNACLKGDADEFDFYFFKTGFLKETFILFLQCGAPKNPFAKMENNHIGGTVHKSILEFAKENQCEEIVKLLNEKYTDPAFRYKPR